MCGIKRDMSIPRVALHEMCLFHATGNMVHANTLQDLSYPCHVTTRFHTCKNEVIIERYCIYLTAVHNMGFAKI